MIQVPAKTEKRKWFDLIPHKERKRAKNLAKRIKKRIGIELPWVMVLLFKRLYLQIQQMPENRGLSRAEVVTVLGVPDEAIDRMVEAGVLEIQQGYEYPMVNGEAAWVGTPVDLFRLSARLEEIMGWRFRGKVEPVPEVQTIIAP